MALATALLQPATLERDSQNALEGLVEDVAKLFAIFGEDAAANGPMLGEVEGAVDEVGQTIADWFMAESATGQTRQARAIASLNARFNPIRAFIEGLVGEAGVASDPTQIIGLLRQLLTLAQGATQAATLPVIRRELEFAKSLIEDDLGFGPDFLGARIAQFLSVLRGRLDALAAPDDGDQRRRLRLARATLARLELRAALLVPPDIDIEPLARLIHRLLETSGVSDALREAGCALDGVETLLNAGLAAGDAVRVTPQSLGAGVVPRPDASEYSYFASWVLRDEDVPLVGLSDLKTPEQFLTTFRTSNNAAIVALRQQMTDAERDRLDTFTGGEPDKERLLTVLAALNREIQRGPILQLGDAFDSDLLNDDELSDEVKNLQRDYRDGQELYLYNRRLVEHVFDGHVDTLAGNFWRKAGQICLDVIRWPSNQVYVTGDRKFVMCDDKPMMSGTDLKWHDAPMFAGSTPHGMWFSFRHAGPEFCEIWTQVLVLVGEAVKGVWHALMIQPGHEAQNATVCTTEFLDVVQQILFGKPISAHFVEGNSDLRRWGKSLDSFVGLKGIFTFFSSFQGIQTDNQSRLETFFYWLTLIGGDTFRTLGPIQTTNTMRDVLIGFVTLLNAGGPRDGPSTLPPNRSWNHEKQAPIVAFSDSMFAMLLVSLLPRDNYSIDVFRAGRDDIGDQKINVFLVHWLAGGLGMGLLSGLSGSLVAQIIAWGEDVPRFFKTGGISGAKMFLLYFLYYYTFKENDTDEGRYRPLGGTYRGYPPRETSPYLLPYPGGTDEYCGQANLGLFSHNRIVNSRFDGTGNAVQQTYAYDFGHDFREPIACCRSGIVWSVVENVGDGIDGPLGWNVLIIQHDTIDAEHDDFGNGPVQTFSVYGHLAQNGVTQAPRFGGTPPDQELTRFGIGGQPGTPVVQGDLIALAGDTGVSFHNHLHMHVVPGVMAAAIPAVPATPTTPAVPAVPARIVPSTIEAIPFVFRDMRNARLPGDGVLKSTSWYRSGNTP